MFLSLVLALTSAFIVCSGVKAADVYEKIEITEMQYPNINFFPRALHLNQGDTLHITVKNLRQGFSRIFIPALNLDQDIAPGAVVNLNVCLAEPIAKLMWFQISSVNGKSVPGYILVSNYETPTACGNSRIVDTSILSDIINYNKNYCYEEKSEPVYKRQYSGAAPVRGYW